jgi:hypothetical protein
LPTCTAIAAIVTITDYHIGANGTFNQLVLPAHSVESEAEGVEEDLQLGWNEPPHR